MNFLLKAHKSPVVISHIPANLITHLSVQTIRRRSTAMSYSVNKTYKTYIRHMHGENGEFGSCITFMNMYSQCKVILILVKLIL